MRTVKAECPACRGEIVFSEDDEVITCQHCRAKFSVGEPEPERGDVSVPDTSATTPPPPPPPPAPPAPPPVQQPQAAQDEQEDEEGDDMPPGAGDAATPSERRRGGRPRFKYTQWPKHVSASLGRTREYQWVAKGGKGCLYGPTSLSKVIWDAVAEAGEAGINIVDIAVNVRERLMESGRWPSRSILQRITMVVERTCSHEDVGLMERLSEDGTPSANGCSFRIAPAHRVEIPLPPDDMIGEARRRELDARRAEDSED